MNTQRSEYSDFYFDKDMEIRGIELRLSGQKPKVEDIYEYSPLIAKDEFIKYTKEIRKSNYVHI